MGLRIFETEPVTMPSGKINYGAAKLDKNGNPIVKKWEDYTDQEKEKWELQERTHEERMEGIAVKSATRELAESIVKQAAAKK